MVTMVTPYIAPTQKVGLPNRNQATRALCHRESPNDSVKPYRRWGVCSNCVNANTVRCPLHDEKCSFKTRSLQNYSRVSRSVPTTAFAYGWESRQKR